MNQPGGRAAMEAVLPRKRLHGWAIAVPFAVRMW